MDNLYKKYPPLLGLHVPSDWLVVKNNMYDVAPEILNLPHTEDDLFLIKDTFFENDIFISKTSLPVSTKKRAISIVSIFARLQENLNDENCIYCIYDIALSFILDDNEFIFTNENGATNRFDAAKIASEYMVIFTQYIMPKLILGEKITQNQFESYIRMYYKERN
ncbi:hypothetical protein I4674_12905 [Proteus mirabilis]|nr:hypothetical protein [Proteus mirabilis]